MPASIAHMIIAHKAIQALKGSQVPEMMEFADLIDDTSQTHHSRPYMNLGSVGPDLYYYNSITSSVKDMILEGFVQAQGVTAWSYHLHSYRPNAFPLSLIEVIFNDAIVQNGQIVLDDQDARKLAYIAGHLTHIAADQILHPLVNRIAGPYYRDGENRRRHRQAEVFQDYYLYEEIYRDRRTKASTGDKAQYDFFEQSFASWVDCITGLTTRNTADWFRYFLQRGFVQTYGMFPAEDVIEDSVDNHLLTLRTCQRVGPYKEAAKEYESQGEQSPMYCQFIKDVNYVAMYQQAVQLAAVYLIALYEVYALLKQGKDFTDKHRDRFCSIVSAADLSCPLEQDILAKALEALNTKKTVAAKYRKAVSC